MTVWPVQHRTCSLASTGAQPFLLHVDWTDRLRANSFLPNAFSLLGCSEGAAGQSITLCCCYLCAGQSSRLHCDPEQAQACNHTRSGCVGRGKWATWQSRCFKKAGLAAGLGRSASTDRKSKLCCECLAYLTLGPVPTFLVAPVVVLANLSSAYGHHILLPESWQDAYVTHDWLSPVSLSTVATQLFHLAIPDDQNNPFMPVLGH